MRKEFELWLDESGDFDNDKQKVKKGWKPSLIGGILVEKGKFKDNIINGIITDDFSHATEEKRQIQFSKFKKIVENAKDKNGFVRFVVFNNEECILVIDNNITYQNIMAGGIIETIKWLKETYNKNEIKLNVIIAKRIDNTNNNQVVEIKEYYKRLKERLIILGLEDNIIQDEDWHLEKQSAREDKRLMLADNICNSFLTRDTKFNKDKEESKYINSVYNDNNMTIIFSVIQNLITSNFQTLMLEGKLGEAVAVICQHDNVDHINKCMEKVEKHLKQMNIGDMELHYRFITAIIELYLNGTRNFGLCEKMLDNIIKYFIPLLEKVNIENNRILGKDIIQKLSFDLQFYLLTLYTHQGNVYGAQTCIDKCDQMIALFPKTMETIIYIVKYEIRKISVQINLFDFDKALETSEDLVYKCSNMKEAQEIFSSDIKFDELAKALGNKVQIYSFLLRKNKKYYKEAKEASDQAISEFTKDSDIMRQYLYRVTLETEAGNYEQALDYLYKSCNLSNASLKELTNRIVQNRNDYEICAYVRLMAEAIIENWEKAEEMFKYIEKTGGIQYIKDIKEKERRHPHEIILWKYATCFVKNNSIKAGLEKYEEAIKVCFSDSDNDLTMNFIGLAIELERYSVVLKNNKKTEAKKYKKSLKENYDKVYSHKLTKSMEDIYKNLDLDNKDWEYYYKLSREITY